MPPINFDSLATQATSSETPQTRADETGGAAVKPPTDGGEGPGPIKDGVYDYIDGNNGPQQGNGKPVVVEATPVDPKEVSWVRPIADPRFDLSYWKNEEVPITLPPENTVIPDPNNPYANDPCYASCLKKQEDTTKKCDALRKRVELFLEATGCPSTVTAKAPQQQQQYGSCNYQTSYQPQYQQSYQSSGGGGCGCGGY